MIKRDIEIESEKTKFVINNDVYEVSNFICYRLTSEMRELNSNGTILTPSDRYPLN